MANFVTFNAVAITFYNVVQKYFTNGLFPSFPKQPVYVSSLKFVSLGRRSKLLLRHLPEVAKLPNAIAGRQGNPRQVRGAQSGQVVTPNILVLIFHVLALGLVEEKSEKKDVVRENYDLPNLSL